MAEKFRRGGNSPVEPVDPSRRIACPEGCSFCRGKQYDYNRNAARPELGKICVGPGHG
jgi:hypothetical protein